MCARALACLRLSRVNLAPNGLLATMRSFYGAFTYQYFSHGHARSHTPPPALSYASRFSARLAILHPDNTVSTSIHIAFGSFEWAVAPNITTRSWNVARRSHVIHGTPRFASHDPLGNPWEPDGYLDACGRPARHDAHSLPPRGDWNLMAPLGFAARTFSLPLPPPRLDAIRALFRADAQRVVLLEFYKQLRNVPQPNPGRGLGPFPFLTHIYRQNVEKQREESAERRVGSGRRRLYALRWKMVPLCSTRTNSFPASSSCCRRRDRDAGEEGRARSPSGSGAAACGRGAADRGGTCGSARCRSSPRSSAASRPRGS